MSVPWTPRAPAQRALVGFGALTAVVLVVALGDTGQRSPDGRKTASDRPRAFVGRGQPQTAAPETAAQPGRSPVLTVGPEPRRNDLHLPGLAELAELTDTPDPKPSATTSGPPTSGTALALLDRLAIREPTSAADFDRDAYGARWADTDIDGCDTRNDILGRDLTEVEFSSDSPGCVVISGQLEADPYTGRRVRFVRGGVPAIGVDHVVGLRSAWINGARAWSHRMRLAFANDPLNLLAVRTDARVTRAGRDAAAWRPAYASSHCRFAAHQVAVKAKYGLSVTAAEHDAFDEVLAGCPDEPAPPRSRATEAPFSTEGDTSPDPRFSSCAEATAYGYGPYRRGRHAEYAWYADLNRDGVVCA